MSCQLWCIVIWSVFVINPKQNVMKGTLAPLILLRNSVMYAKGSACLVYYLERSRDGASRGDFVVVSSLMEIYIP